MVIPRKPGESRMSIVQIIQGIINNLAVILWPVRTATIA